MRVSALREWRRTRDTGALETVRHFFEVVGEYLTQGTPPGGDSHLDLIIVTPSGKTIGVEVKGQSEDHPFRVELSQLERHRAEVNQFPYEGLLCYLLFSYTSQQSRTVVLRGVRRRRLLRDHVVAGEGVGFLANHVRECWMLPAEAILELRDEGLLLERGKFPAQPDTLTLSLRRSLLRSLSEHQRFGKGWRVMHGGFSGIVPVGGKFYALSFPVTMLVHPAYPLIDLQCVNWTRRAL